MDRISSFASEAFSVFESHGILVTEKKRIVIYAVGTAGREFDADSVYIKMRNTGISVCFGTVRKVISLLLRFGLLATISYGSKRRKFRRRATDKELRSKRTSSGLCSNIL